MNRLIVDVTIYPYSIDTWRTLKDPKIESDLSELLETVVALFDNLTDKGLCEYIPIEEFHIPHSIHRVIGPICEGSSYIDCNLRYVQRRRPKVDVYRDRINNRRKYFKNYTRWFTKCIKINNCRVFGFGFYPEWIAWMLIQEIKKALKSSSYEDLIQNGIDVRGGHFTFNPEEFQNTFDYDGSPQK